MKKLIILGGVVLMTASSFSIAGNGGKGKPTFESFDSNSDGIITLAEAKGRFAKRFASIDTDNSESITKAEFDTMMANKSNKSKKQGSFKTLDTNHNGEVSGDIAVERQS